MINPHNIFKWAHTFGQSKKTVDFSLTYNYLSSSMYCNRFHDHTFVLEQMMNFHNNMLIYRHDSPNHMVTPKLAFETWYKKLSWDLRHLKYFFLSMARLYFCPWPGVLKKNTCQNFFFKEVVCNANWQSVNTWK